MGAQPWLQVPQQ